MKNNKVYLTESEVKYIVKQGVERLLMESQESDSQKLAIRYIMENFKWDKEKADYFVRKTLRDRITPLRNKRIAKFTLGVTRMWFNGELDDDNTVSSFNATLPLLSAHINEYDKDLNGITARELIGRFVQTRQDNMDNERAEIETMDFSQGSNYQIHKIDSFEEAQKYYNYTNPNSRWCLTYMENMYNNYTSNGINQMYFCLRNGFEDVPQQVGENCPLDEYGLSMLSIIVDETGGLAYCTTRWNHENGGNDSAMNAKEVSQVVGVNFYQVFKPNTKWQEITANINQQLMSDIPLENIFDRVSKLCRNDEFIPVAFEGRRNYVTRDRKLLCKKWFDDVKQFHNGVGMVSQGGRANFVDTNGELISQTWFDWAQPFVNGAAMVGFETNYDNGDMPLNFIDKKGRLISKNNFEKARNFSEDGYAPVCFDNTVGWTIIDRSGNDVLNGKTYSFISTVYDGRCSVSVYDPETHKDYFYIMDVKTGKLLNKEPFHRLEYEGVGIYRVSNLSNTRIRFINSDAQYINDDVYDAASTTFGTKGVSAVRIGTKCNLLRPDGTYCSDVWFDAMANIRGTSCFNVYLEGYGSNIIDIHGKMLSSVWFTDTGERCQSTDNSICRLYMDKRNNVWAFKAEGDSGIVVPSNKADFL